MKRFDIINKLIQKNNYQSYLEIGVRGGGCFNRVVCKNKLGVDPEPIYREERIILETSDEFFGKNSERFDIVFIDGLHIADQVWKDVNNSIKSLNKGGTIVLHDCNPNNELIQRVPRQSQTWTGDVWKAWVWSMVEFKDRFEMFVVDTDMGVGVMTVGSTDYQEEVPKELTYDWLMFNRDEALNLISVEEFDRWTR